MTRGDLRREFGMVLQDTWLFGGTVAENLAYGRPDATREEIIAAAKAAARRLLHTHAAARLRYRTRQRGRRTCRSGQRQLLTIARVFLADPPILILDEATSSVDTRTEAEIGKAMTRLMSRTHQLRHRAPAVDDP